MAFQSALMKVLVMASTVAALPSPQITKIVDNINEKGPLYRRRHSQHLRNEPSSPVFGVQLLRPLPYGGPPRSEIPHRNHRRQECHPRHDRISDDERRNNDGAAAELFHGERNCTLWNCGQRRPLSAHRDVTIPRYWAHTGLWNWQRYGDGPEDELALEENGDYTREFGFLHFASFQNSSESNPADNLLNNVWFQPEEIFPVTGTPEVRQHAFWVPVDDSYYRISESLQALELESCVNATTCLSHAPRVVRVERGCSANVYLDNAAYRSFIRAKFNVTAVDMESAAVALVSAAQGVPFIAIRALSDLAGGGSAESNEASTFASLAAQNAVTVVSQFVKLLSTESSILSLRSD